MPKTISAIGRRSLKAHVPGEVQLLVDRPAAPAGNATRYASAPASPLTSPRRSEGRGCRQRWPRANVGRPRRCSRDGPIRQRGSCQPPPSAGSRPLDCAISAVRVATKVMGNQLVSSVIAHARPHAGAQPPPACQAASVRTRISEVLRSGPDEDEPIHQRRWVRRSSRENTSGPAASLTAPSTEDRAACKMSLDRGASRARRRRRRPRAP